MAHCNETVSTADYAANDGIGREIHILEDAARDAARMREFFLSDNRAAWQRYTPQVLWEDYEEMKEAVLPRG